MATSSNATIQALMNEVDQLEAGDSSLEAKLAMIAQKVAEEQQKVQSALTGKQFVPAIADDPADAFACLGCQ